MNPRAHTLIADLDLKPHPEGGYYREIFRSVTKVRPDDHRAERSALTAIYFLLVTGQHSGWHQVQSDEIWSHLEGDALELLCFDAGSADASTIELGRFSAGGAVPIHVVPAGMWQAARPLGEYALLGCYVGPGFDFSDFSMASDDAEMCRILTQQGESFAAYL
ncbi:MAG: cupin domain-containing protein [Nitrosomonadales bacterium]|nr:cupin domain-containing protein [Nitrosomonadales bacterium]